MGAGLAIAAEALALRMKLNHVPARILFGMALRALDRDTEPVYYAGYDVLAVASGRDPNEAGRKAAQRGVRQLIELGLLRRINPAPNRNTRYFLLNGDGLPLAPLRKETAENALSTVDTQRPANGGHSASSDISTVDTQRPANGGHSLTQRWTPSDPTVDTQRPPERKREQGGEVGGAPSLPSISSTTTSAEASAALESQPPLTCTNKNHAPGQREAPCGPCGNDRRAFESWQNRPRAPLPHQCINGHKWIPEAHAAKSTCTRCPETWWHDESEPRVAPGTTR